MVYFLYGPDDYSIKERLRELVKDTAVHAIRAEEELKELHAQGLQEGLFGEPTSIVIHELLPGLTTEWLEKQTTDVIVLAGATLDKRTTLYKWLMKQSAEEFLPKEKGHVFAWVKNQGYTIEPSVLQLLWDRHQSNLWLWHQELAKLQAYAGYSNPITSAHIQILIGKTVEDNVFIFLDEFGNRSQKSGRLYMQLLEYGADEYYVFSMLARQVRLLLLANEPNGLHDQHPFVVKKLHQQAKKWQKNELIQAHTLLLKIDQRTKTGRADIEDELPAFVLEYTQ